MEFGNQSKSYLSNLERIAKYNLLAYAYQKLTVGGTAVSLTVPLDAKYADISVESSNTSTVAIRYLITGGIPTATDGKPLNHLTEFDIQGQPNLINFKAIQTGAGTHTLHIQYYK